MFEKIVVPLDGSKLAECALPYVEELAKGCTVNEVTLIGVTERIVGWTQAPEMQEIAPSSSPDTTVAMGRKQEEAEKYLNNVAKELSAKGIPAKKQVLIGNPADEIISFVEENKSDIIVMSSHGRSGPSRWAYGSVADKVFRATCVPVLMVRAPGCFPGI